MSQIEWLHYLFLLSQYSSMQNKQTDKELTSDKEMGLEC